MGEGIITCYSNKVYSMIMFTLPLLGKVDSEGIITYP